MAKTLRKKNKRIPKTKVLNRLEREKTQFFQLFKMSNLLDNYLLSQESKLETLRKVAADRVPLANALASGLVKNVTFEDACLPTELWSRFLDDTEIPYLRVYKHASDHLVTLIVNPCFTTLKRKNAVRRVFSKYRAASAYVEDIRKMDANGRVDRKTEVLELIHKWSDGGDKNATITYRVGEIVEPSNEIFNLDIEKVCSSGIHFYLTESAARGASVGTWPKGGAKFNDGVSLVLDQMDDNGTSENIAACFPCSDNKNLWWIRNYAMGDKLSNIWLVSIFSDNDGSHYSPPVEQQFTFGKNGKVQMNGIMSCNTFADTWPVFCGTVGKDGSYRSAVCHVSRDATAVKGRVFGYNHPFKLSEETRRYCSDVSDNKKLFKLLHYAGKWGVFLEEDRVDGHAIETVANVFRTVKDINLAHEMSKKKCEVVEEIVSKKKCEVVEE
jgi:hypothetical protein